MQGRELPLNIHAGSELSGRADNDFYFGIIHLFKHGKALFVVCGVINESDFIFGKFARPHQPVPKRLIYRECVLFWRIRVAENRLRRAGIRLVYLDYFFSTEGNLSAVIFLGFRVDNAGVQRDFGHVSADGEHIILVRLYHFRFDPPCALDPLIGLQFLLRGFFADYHFRLSVLDRRKLEVHISRLCNVEHLAEQIAKFVQIDEIRKSRPRTESVTAGLDLDGLGDYAENGSPIVKVADIHIVQRLLLQKVLPYKQLGYGVADRRSSGENHTAAVMKLLQIAALHLHIERFLRVRICVHAGDVVHLGENGEVLVVMCFVHKKKITPEFLECDEIIFLECGAHFLDFLLDLLALALQSLDRETLALICFRRLYRIGDFGQLLIIHRLLTFKGQRHFFKLRLRNDNRVEIPDGYL